MTERAGTARGVVALLTGAALIAGAGHAAVRGLDARDAGLRTSTATPPAFALFAGRDEPEPVWIYEGRDIDGDGAADFANPTGEAPREHDDYGAGHFGASRDGGSREHAGVDYEAKAGQIVVAPISGYVTKVGYCYSDEPGLRYVEIKNPALKLSARVLYVRADVKVGETVRMGTPIGRAATLQDRYPGITDHVHLEIRRHGRTIDPERVIVARLERTGDRG
jgi:murein DD-endopeptidase MepM/ murein hydrolase activator NlpD